MKSLQDIRDEFLDQQRQEHAEALAKVREARAELDALLQRAGIKDGPDYMFGDDADSSRDEDYYRRRVRELVFKVPDQELRRQIMAKLSSYRYELWDRWEMRRHVAASPGRPLHLRTALAAYSSPTSGRSRSEARSAPFLLPVTESFAETI